AVADRPERRADRIDAHDVDLADPAAGLLRVHDPRSRGDFAGQYAGRDLRVARVVADVAIECAGGLGGGRAAVLAADSLPANAALPGCIGNGQRRKNTCRPPAAF